MWVQSMGLGKAIRSFRPYRPEVDALLIAPESIILIEGKIVKVMDGMSKLPIYRSLIPTTPELIAYKSMPVRCILLTAKPPGWVGDVSEEHNVEIVEFRPNWLDEYYNRREEYWTQEEREKRQGRKATLQRLGFD